MSVTLPSLFPDFCPVGNGTIIHSDSHFKHDSFWFSSFYHANTSSNTVCTSFQMHCQIQEGTQARFLLPLSSILSVPYLGTTYQMSWQWKLCDHMTVLFFAMSLPPYHPWYKQSRGKPGSGSGSNPVQDGAGRPAPASLPHTPASAVHAKIK